MRQLPSDIAVADVTHAMYSEALNVYDAAQQTLIQGLSSSKNHKEVTVLAHWEAFCCCICIPTNIQGTR